MCLSKKSFLWTVRSLLAAGVLAVGCGNSANRETPDSDGPHACMPDTGSTVDSGTQKDASVTGSDTETELDTGTDTGPGADERAEVCLAQMTLEEKIDYIGGERSFFVRAIPRLGIPEIKMSDGPVGCRNWGASTAYPASVGLAAAFDTNLARSVGRSIGSDCRARGVHILLGPGVNIHRSPLGGRNFEYLGEDPFLAGETAAAYIQGVSDRGVAATVKHFVGNNQEWDRNYISSEVDERTLREIYLPAFERAVKKGNVSAVMTAYNLLNGTYCSHDASLLKSVLRDDWGFKGLVMSDWGAVHDTAGAATNGLDLEMPSGKYLNRDTLLPLIENGTLSESEIDDKVRHILRTLIVGGFFDRPQIDETIPLDDPDSREVALDAARKSAVLLKNSAALLPLDPSEVRKIALIGPNVHPAVTGGSGSSYVTPNRTVSLLDGLAEVAPNLQVSYHPGIQRTDTDTAAQAASDIDSLAREADAVVIALGFGQSKESNTAAEAFAPAWPPAWALDGFVEAEGADRPFDLPSEQVETVRRAAAANPKTVVILSAGGAVNATPFIDDIAAFIWAGYPGQEGGRALAELLLGEINFSGKLPFTFAASYNDYPGAPYYSINDNGKTPYTEGIFVGYRGFDRDGIEPLFPFGFGLSYTSFTYNDLNTEVRADGSIALTLSVTNAGSVFGDEVVQVYVAPPASSISRAPKTLAGFARVSLAPGETAPVSMILGARAFAYWDVNAHQWQVEAGDYQLLIGASSRDLFLSDTVSIDARTVDPRDASVL